MVDEEFSDSQSIIVRSDKTSAIKRQQGNGEYFISNVFAEKIFGQISKK